MNIKWRWAKDSNLRRGQTLNGFQDRRFRPLSQPTGNLYCSYCRAGGIIQFCYLDTRGEKPPGQIIATSYLLGDGIYRSSFRRTSGIVGNTWRRLSAGYDRVSHIFTE